MKAQAHINKLSEKEIKRRLSRIYDIALLAYHRTQRLPNNPPTTGQGEHPKGSEERSE